ncbi:2-Methylisocitrate lyase, PEP mutase family [Streptomyces sp. cf386]|uniref:isocitrate lyase/PEP mutase family protein n=1 Tax=Streptomyces sp. cf386 TaxID=1761904 RepID=UPI00088909B3|nr:isocitrate lyase/phosphoenolpyruvate mutase family protein [Streptomyces sp. cf386]SDM31353.1 2-Methylisocitrate lyase, PEP mutase family [Streptomyces sp. cf386]
MQLNPDDQYRRAVAFARLHEGDRAFVVANAWDAGSARLLWQLGFQALATTSAGLALSLGRPDGANLVGRDEVLENARAIVAATPLPVSSDLESCYADSAEGVAETIRLAAEAGLVGASIEDATGDPDHPIRPAAEATERVAAAVEAARALPFPFTLTARAENFLYGRADLKDTIARLQAFEEAGADVLYAPALPDLDAIRTVRAAVGKPLNVLAGVGATASVDELSTCGARRISVGSAFARAALGGFLGAALEVRDHGTFAFVEGALAYGEANERMSCGGGSGA